MDSAMAMLLLPSLQDHIGTDAHVRNVLHVQHCTCIPSYCQIHSSAFTKAVGAKHARTWPAS
jgi:hypothetical protein